MVVLGAVIASGFGALARFGVSGVVQRRARSGRPVGTAAVNLLGAMLLGLLVGVAGSDHDDLVVVAGTGFLGSFTTFSTWMVESVRLGEEGAAAGLVAIGVNVGLMLVVGVAAAAVGASFG